DKEKIAFQYLSERGKPMVREHAFEGIIPNLERRYRETDSIMVREELAKYLNSKPCPECDGTRLRREARHVKVGGRAIYEVSNWPLKETSEFFRDLKLEGQRQAIADKIVKEIVNRLQFLNNVGLDYLALDHPAHSLTGQYLAGHRQIPIPARRRRIDTGRRLTITGATGNNLKGITLSLPVGLFVCVTGVSGSGKSTLINDTLYSAVARH